MMSVQMELKDSRVLHLRIGGKLQKEDYDSFAPEIEREINKSGKIRLLVEMKDFHGWSMGALWEDIKFDVRHFSDIERLALVGDKKWQKGMANFCRPFTRAEVKFFTPDQLQEASEWLNS